MKWLALGIAAILLAALVYWRIRKRRRTRLISFVAFTREPVSFDPAILASIAGRVWKADLGDGSSEGADGFVVCHEISSLIQHNDRMFLINSFPTPYIENADQIAENIADMRLRQLFREHRAWFSCDAMGVDRTTPDEDVRKWYQRLGKLFAELLDDKCLLIYLPDEQCAYPINEDTASALRSKDPIRALRETYTVPIIEVAPDDPLMQQAVQRARAEWHKFVAAFEAATGENFAVKAPVSQGDNTEFIWLSVTSFEGERIYGELANEPGNLGSLKLGSKVSVAVADLNDWCYIDTKGNVVGGFTIEAVNRAARHKRKE